jgi:hypothetical protein
LSGYGFIRPGAEGTVLFGAAPDTVTAAAALLAVIYEDRTAEGNPDRIGILFHSRQLRAEDARAAAELLASYPASPEEMRSRLGKLAAMKMNAGSVESILKGNTGREQWNQAASEQKKLADFLAEQSKEATR